MESFENLVYRGTGGLLQQEINMKGVDEYLNDLFGFPFDHQAYHTKLQLKKHQDICIITNHLNSSVTFSGNKLLTELEMTVYYLFSSENEEGIEFGYSIEFKLLYLKRSGYKIATYKIATYKIATLQNSHSNKIATSTK